MSFFDDRPFEGKPREAGEGFSLTPLIGAHAFVAKRAAATSVLVLTTGNQDVVGATLTLDTPGVYVVMAVLVFDGAAGDGDGVGEMLVDGVIQPGGVLVSLADTERVTCPQNWVVKKTTLGPTIVKLQARKTSGGGASTVESSSTTILAFTVPGSQDLSLLG